MTSKPTPYAFAPTKNGQKLPWELGIPEDGRVLPPVPTGHRNTTSGSTSTGSSSSATGSADPSPYRPGRMWEAFREQQHEQQHGDQVKQRPSPPPPPPQAVVRRRDVCTCQRCPADMPTRAEKKCCMKEDTAKTYFEGYQEGVCLTTAAEVQHLLHPISVKTSWLAKRQYLGYQGEDLNFELMTNENYRYHAYRNYTKYIHGILGQFRRKVVPACIVTAIRNTWPSETYRGFIDVDEDGQPLPPDYDELEALEGEQI